MSIFKWLKRSNKCRHEAKELCIDSVDASKVDSMFYRVDVIFVCLCCGEKMPFGASVCSSEFWIEIEKARKTIRDSDRAIEERKQSQQVQP